ncbi:hypothetical protein K7564_08900 [Stenotrophomonas maltophilia]|nr:hypothetical protein K7564_08900 [Stenotrophomonas maltophilia]
MSNDKKTMEDVRNLIVCDTQFGWTGSTTLRLQQMLALQERGWLAEGAENNEFDLTDAGRDVVARALQSAVQPTLADVQPGGRVRLGDQAERAQWRSMDTCPRDGTVVRLRWGEDHVSPGWWSAPVSPVQNDDGTWPSDTGGFPWAFIDFNNGSAFVNHAVDTEYGPTHWAPYVALSAQPSPGGQDALAALQRDYDKLLDSFNRQVEVAEKIAGRVLQQDDRIEELEEALASRQPVGEPVAYTDGNEFVCAAEYATMRGLGHDGNGWRPLYAAQPAQAVDLDELRRAACVVNIVGQIDGHDVVRRDSVLDVIDTRRQRLTESQAVGNG